MIKLNLKVSTLGPVRLIWKKNVNKQITINRPHSDSFLIKKHYFPHNRKRKTNLSIINKCFEEKKIELNLQSQVLKFNVFLYMSNAFNIIFIEFEVLGWKLE